MMMMMTDWLNYISDLLALKEFLSVLSLLAMGEN
jgi:hypothetical protein